MVCTSEKCLKAALYVILIYNLLWGLAPFKYNSATRSFESSVLCLFYCGCIACGHTLVYSVYLFPGYSDTTGLYLILGIVSVITIILVYYIQGKYCNRLIDHVNMSLNLSIKLNRLLVDQNVNYLKLMFKLFIMGLFTIFICIASIGKLHAIWILTNDNNSFTYSSITLTSRVFGYIIHTIIINTFYAALCISKYYFEVINFKLKRVMNTAQQEKIRNVRQKKYLKMKIFCDLSDEVDKLGQLHSSLLENVLSLNNTFGFQLILELNYFFILFIHQVLVLYY